LLTNLVYEVEGPIKVPVDQVTGTLASQRPDPGGMPGPKISNNEPIARGSQTQKDMKEIIVDNQCKPGHARALRGRTAGLAAGLALALFAVPSGSGVTPLYQETFDSDSHWSHGVNGLMTVTNGEASLQYRRVARTDPNNISSTYTAFRPWWGEGNSNNWSVLIQPGHALEVRTDAVRFNQDDAFVGMIVDHNYDGYALFLDRNEITLLKYGNASNGFFYAFFFWDQVTHPGTNLRLSAAFTQVDADLAIQIRVLDKAQANAVLYDRTVWDTAGQDPVLPNRAVKGILMQPEGNIAPYVGLDLAPLVGVLYCNTTNLPAGFPQVTIDNVEIWENQAPLADASASQLLYISPNGVNASVTLDGSRSSDPNGDVLDYLWFSTIDSQPSTILASGVQAVVLLPVGMNPIELVVNDGMATATNAITVEVITTAEAVQRLIVQVQSGWRRSQPLLATLYAALHSIERGNPVSARNQLQAFQNKVRAQVAPRDPALAACLTQTAQEIMDALSTANRNPALRRHDPILSLAR
jgi:hypothetical protein